MVMKKSYYSVGGEIIGEKSGGARTDYLTDALGSVTATVGQAGAVINRYTYKPYGGLLAKTGVGADPNYQWVGSLGYRQTAKKYSDVYVRARHYDTANGRWTTKDPVGFESGDWNLLKYTSCSPTTLVDPTGRETCDPKKKPKCGDSTWIALCASTWKCGEKGLGTTCLACATYLQQSTACASDPCICDGLPTKKRNKNQSCDCAHVTLFGVPASGAAAMRKSGTIANWFGCGQQVSIKLGPNANAKTVTIVDEGPHEPGRQIDINGAVFGLSGLYWVCAKKLGVDSRIQPCPDCYNNTEEGDCDKKSCK
jgi:RHS repeat-associated protein